MRSWRSAEGRRATGNEGWMSGLRVLGFASAALCALVGRAGACPINLDGDADVIERVRAELGDFHDDGACVAVWARCRSTGGQLEIDLHDELGRSSLHLFMSADGAAAFLISWSRRPLADPQPDRAPGGPPGGPPGLVAAGPAPASASPPAPLDRPWHPEIGLAYVAASGDHGPWGTTTVEVRKNTGIWRYGGGGRLIAGTSGLMLVAGVEAAAGVQLALLPTVTVLGELFVGDETIVRDAGYSGELDYGAQGPRAGVRAAMDWQFGGPLRLELEWGYDAVQSYDPQSMSDVMRLRGLAVPSHISLGFRWQP